MERIKKTMDGNHAAAYVAYAYTDVAAIYPITPSTVMAEAVDEWAAAGQENIWGNRVEVVEMQSEAGAAGAVHGALAAGALTTTFTASQGLLLMIPNLYRLAGERQPGVFHIAARTIATHALSIFGDHSDICACRQTGVSIFCENSVQEIMDLAPAVHLAAIDARMPFLNFFDGFRTSHEIQKISCWRYEELREMLEEKKVTEFKKQALNPNHPYELGSAQNPDLYFQTREACNKDYLELPKILKGYINQINQRLGTQYDLFEYYGAFDATTIIIAMGSVCETVEETIDYLKEKGEKNGLVKVRLYRPFVREEFLKKIPKTARRIEVLDRTKEPGALGEPLYLDVVAAIQASEFKDVCVQSGRYGLSSKETTVGQIISVFHNKDLKEFTIGIIDDVTNLSLEPMESPEIKGKDQKDCKFWGLGSDGTVGANKNSIKIIGDHTSHYVQAYFEYDSKKSGGITISHLRFGKDPIRSAYAVQKADFVACHCPVYIHQYEIVQDLVKGGTFLLNCPWKEEELTEVLPFEVKKYLAEKEIKFYIIDATKIAKEIGLKSKTNTILQAAFFALSEVMPKEEAFVYMKEAVERSYAKKGQEVVRMNWEAIDAGAKNFHQVSIPIEWNALRECNQKIVKDETNARETKENKLTTFVKDIMKPVDQRKGDKLPVSACYPYRNGWTPSGSSAFEKRGVAEEVPIWDVEACIQCNQCSFVCPHAVIRPVVLSEEELKNSPEGMRCKTMTGLTDFKYAITISTLDCTGCANCVEICPAPGKALFMKKIEETGKQQLFFDYGISVGIKNEAIQKFRTTTVKGSQFKRPLLEFSGACGGCGETPYAKLATQLFGSRMLIANATGCSSIWGNSSPSTPYTFDENGRGPAWANSLFEDAAEFGYGMLLAQNCRREQLKVRIQKILKEMEEQTDEDCLYLREWLETYNEGTANQIATDKLVHWLENLMDKSEKNDQREEHDLKQVRSKDVMELLRDQDFLSKKSQWIFGGDGWAYDIGFGGLDHVLASGDDLNVLVFDTEIYSNTGGQSSKATQMGAVAQLCATGKRQKKKKLAEMMMQYGNVYVAQVSMGADKNQCIKAFIEAEQYQGPSLIIAYAPCISHGIRKGMRYAQEEEKAAVEKGYWFNFRYQPADTRHEKAVFYLDSKEPSGEIRDYLQGENRFLALEKVFPDKFNKIWEELQQDSQEKYEGLKRLQESLH